MEYTLKDYAAIKKFRKHHKKLRIIYIFGVAFFITLCLALSVAGALLLAFQPENILGSLLLILLFILGIPAVLFAIKYNNLYEKTFIKIYTQIDETTLQINDFIGEKISNEETLRVYMAKIKMGILPYEHYK
ncbi:MAG: hypothetical protein FWH20_07450 [Oscillospiraceae bacterium]|nr:hypothetical protein [Oscillospiraceae bacterium]